MIVLGDFAYVVYIQWVMKVNAEKDNKCGREKTPFRGKRIPFIMQKDYIYYAEVT